MLTVRVADKGYVEEYVWHLWNNKDINSGSNIVSLKLGVACSNGLFTGQTTYQGQEAVTEKWISVKSNGAGGSGIVDDANASFKAVGGALDDVDNYLSLGDMPADTYRQIYVRVEVPAGAESDGFTYPVLVLEYTLEDPSVSSSSISTSSSSSSYSESEPDDDFTGTDDDNPWGPRWEITDAAPKIISNRLQMDVGSGNVLEEIRSKWLTEGQFDVVVYYYIDANTDIDWWRIDLKAEPQDASNDYWTASRLYNTAYYAGGVHSFDQYDNSEVTLYAKVYATNALEGRLRLKRDIGGTAIRAYYWNGVSYTEMIPDTPISSSAGMKFILRAEVGGSNPSLDMSFDRFNHIKGTWAWS